MSISSLRSQRSVVAVITGLVICCCVSTALVAGALFLSPSQAQANIWLAHRFADKQIFRALAVDSPNLSLVVGLDRSLERVYPDGRQQRIREHDGRKLVLLTNGTYIDSRDGSIVINDSETIPLQEPMALRDPLPSDTSKNPPAPATSTNSVKIKVQSIAVNSKGAIFVGGYRAEEEDDPKREYFVWELSKAEQSPAPAPAQEQYVLRAASAQPSPLEETKPKPHSVWEATTLATAQVPPRLISTNSDVALLLDNPSGAQQLLPTAAGKLQLRPFSPRLPCGVRVTGLDIHRSRVAHDDDGTTVISDADNSCIWRLSVDGDRLEGITGGDTRRKSYERDPLRTPGKIAIAPDGGIFVDDSHKSILFIGPNDQLEQNLARWISDIEELAGQGQFEQAKYRLTAIKHLARSEGKTMRGWRAEIALTTLRFRIGESAVAEVENWGMTTGPTLSSDHTTNSNPKKKGKEKCTGCF